MEQVNLFHKGISTDPDYSKRDNQSWDFPTLNARMQNKEGQGYIVTDLPGNTLVDVNHLEGEVFRISPGFVIIGATEYNGIVYICSVNESDPLNVIGEIGCFPSPNSIGSFIPPWPVPSFERVYRPLNNFVDPSTTLPPFDSTTPRQPLSTVLFDWDSIHQIDMFPREDYDNSINLYICNNKNPNIIINTGFDQQGTLTHRLYNENDFNTIINQIMAIGNFLHVELKEITPGGCFKYGNIVFYFRYQTIDFNSTPFIAESNACQIHKGDLSNLGDVEGGSYSDDSDKQVVFNVSNVETSYTYIEVAYIRYFSDSTGVILSEAYLIDRKWDTAGMTEIPITGHDPVIPIDKGQLIVNKSIETICKTHNQNENIYFGANWKGLEIAHDALADVSLRITLKYDADFVIDGTSYYTHETTAIDKNTVPNISGRLGQYKDYFKTYDYAGYFRIETYPFSACYELNDGSITPSYPVTGLDDIDGVGTTTNSLGLYRFPSQFVSNILDGNQKLHIMGIKFDLTAFLAYLSLPGSSHYAWIRKNVRSIRLMRGDRFVNLRYQGLMMNCCKPFTSDGDDKLTTDINSITFPLDGMTKLFAPEQDVSNHNGGHTYYGQVPAKYNDLSSPTVVMDLWWRKICGTPAHYETGCDPEVCLDNMLIPMYKGYAPMYYHHTTNDELVNYASRWPMKKGCYAFYSPDDIFVTYNDFSNCNHLQKISQITVNEKFDYQVGNPLMMAPHTAFVDTEALTYYNPFLPATPTIDITSNTVSVGKQTTASVAIPVPHSGSTSYLVNQSDDYFKGGNGGSNTLWWRQKPGGWGQTAQIWSNRSMYTMPYQFIYDPSNAPSVFAFYNNSICNVYNTDPTDPTYSILNLGLSISNYSSIPFHYISDPIVLWEDDGSLAPNNTYTCYKGDCYLQRTYFKQMAWNCSDVTANYTQIGCAYDGSTAQTYDYPNDGSVITMNTHGVIIGIITENTVNTAMRYSTTSFDYYPHKELWPMVTIPSSNGVFLESLLYNAGHQSQLGLKEIMGFNSLLPFNVTKKPTRIRYSAYHVPYSFVDGYRIFDVNSYKDYDLQYGEINSLQVIDNTLISYQEGSVNQHYNSEQQLKAPTDSGDLILGTGPILAQQVRRIGEFGTKHQWSVKKGSTGLYSWDFDRRILGKISTGIMGMSTGLVGEAISLTKAIEKWLYDLSDIIDSRTDRVVEFRDNPVNFEGIVTGTDRKYKEIYFTFLYTDTDVNSPTFGSHNKTLVFNEILNAFTSEYSFTPSCYLNILNDIYSPAPTLQDYIFRHNIEGAPSLRFYGLDYPWQLSYIVNGYGVQGGVLANKMYLGNDIEMSHHNLSRVLYETEYQTSVHDWSLMALEYWLTPTYQEHKWKFPVNTQTSPVDDAFSPGAPMRGTWMKTTLEYLGNDPIYIKNIVTNYIPSQS